MIREMKAALFDLDGVLVDTAKYHYLAWKRLADSLSVEFGPDDNEALKGVSRRESLDRILALGGITDMTEEEKTILAARKNEWYLEYVSSMTPEELLEGAVDFISRLRTRGVKTALGSASRNAPEILRRTGIEKLFDAIIDGNATSRSKPDPEVFLLGARAVGIEPERCVVFEDAAAGIRAAKNASMRAVGIGRPADLPEADMVIPGLSSLVWDRP